MAQILDNRTTFDHYYSYLKFYIIYANYFHTCKAYYLTTTSQEGLGGILEDQSILDN
jgi:hypothetical protein